MQSVTPLGIAAVALGAILIGVGILLVVAGFVITAVQDSRPKQPGPAAQAGFFDFMTELAKRVQLIYIPGFIMIGLGIFLVGIVVVGAGPFVEPASGGTPTVSAPPSAVPSPAAS